MAGTEQDFGSMTREQLLKTQEQMNQILTSSQASRTTAAEQTANLNQQSQAAFEQRRLQGQQAQNQFAQNQAANQMSALDAIRRTNASAIASGANAGLSAANQLSAILGLQEQGAEAATNLANDAITSAAQLNTDLAQNAVEGQAQANTLNAQLGANDAETAKSLSALMQALSGIQTAETQAKVAENEKQQASYNNAVSSLDAIIGSAEYTTDSRQRAQALRNRLTAAFNQNNTEEINKILNEIANPPEFWTSITPPQNVSPQYTEEVQNKNASNSCVTGDTLITLADGNKRPAKDMKVGDMIQTYDASQKTNVTARLAYSYTLPAHEKSPLLILHFSNGEEVKITGGHTFLRNNNKVVTLNYKNVRRYVNKEFKVGVTETAMLTSFDLLPENELRYALFAEKHLWLYTNNILSAADDIEFILQARLSNPAVPANKLCTYEYLKRIIKDVPNPEELYQNFDGEMFFYWAKGFRKFFLGKKIKKLIKTLP